MLVRKICRASLFFTIIGFMPQILNYTNMKLFNKALVVVCIAAFAAAAHAEVVTLKNGDRVTGNLISENPDQVVIESPAFGVLTIAKTNMASMIKDTPAPTAAPSEATTQAAASQTAVAAAPAEDPTAPTPKKREPLGESLDAYRGFLKDYLPEGWQFRLRGALEYKESISETFDVGVAFDVKRVWKQSEFNGSLYYNYTTEKANENAVRETTTDKYGADTSFRYNFTEDTNWYVKNLLNYKRDTVKGIHDQVDEAVTFGYRFDFKQYDLIIDIAPGPAARYVNADGYDQKWVFMAVLDESLSWKISDLLRLEQSFYGGINATNLNKYTMYLKLGLIFKATDVMDIALRYSYEYDGINDDNAQKTEQRLLLSFEFPFNWVY